jgi:nucleotide-binding universal stress UspA family protein
MNGPVVVAVDGSPASLTAVEAAAREADVHGVSLRLAHAVTSPPGRVTPGVPPWDTEGVGLRGIVNGTLTEAERRARSVAPHVAITHEVLFGEPMTVLESGSRAASLTVVGIGPTSRFRTLPHGTVDGRLTARGHCPVLVVRGRPDPTGPVVLAMEASPAARKAAEFAFAQASARGEDLEVLYIPSAWAAWRCKGPAASRSRTRDPDRAGDDDQSAVSRLRGKYPDVTVRSRRIRVRIGRAVVEASAGAQLLVVGARKDGRPTGVLPPTVGWAALRHAHCPVALVSREQAGL